MRSPTAGPCQRNFCVVTWGRSRGLHDHKGHLSFSPVGRGAQQDGRRRPACLASSTPMKRTLKRWLLLAVGWAFVALGVAGLFLPFLQGILLLLIGLSILSTEYAWAHKVLQKIRLRFPGLRADSIKLGPGPEYG